MSNQYVMWARPECLDNLNPDELLAAGEEAFALYTAVGAKLAELEARAAERKAKLQARMSGKAPRAQRRTKEEIERDEHEKALKRQQKNAAKAAVNGAASATVS